MRTSRKQGREKSKSRPRAAHRQRKAILPSAPLPEHISHNIETIIELHTRHEQDVPRHQRVVEAVSVFFGRPVFLYSIIFLIALWIYANVLPRRFGFPQFDPPPFPWLQDLLNIGSLLITTGVLITQNRQEKLAEQRMQLSLQLNMLSEQKIAKLIALIEELRHDLPIVEDRLDSEAEMMKESVDPEVVVETLEQTLEEELTELHKHKSK